jgi:hypothetical protein
LEEITQLLLAGEGLCWVWNALLRITKPEVFCLETRVKDIAGHQQLTPVILATQEAEIRKIAV